MSIELYIPEIGDELGVTDYWYLDYRSSNISSLIVSAAQVKCVWQLSKLLELSDERLIGFFDSDWNAFWPKPTEESINSRVDFFVFLLSCTEKKYVQYKTAAVYLLSTYFIYSDTEPKYYDFALEIIGRIADTIGWDKWDQIKLLIGSLSQIIDTIKTETKTLIITLLVDCLYSSTRIPWLLRLYQDSIRTAYT